MMLSRPRSPPAVRIAKEYVLGDGLVGGEIELLVDDRDAQPLRRRAGLWISMGRPSRMISSGILLVGAGQDLDERGLAGAVLTGQGHDLARMRDRSTSSRAWMPPKRLLMPRACNSGTAGTPSVVIVDTTADHSSMAGRLRLAGLPVTVPVTGNGAAIE